MDGSDIHGNYPPVTGTDMSRSSREFIPILLSAKKSAWRAEGEFDGDLEFQKVKPAILGRDDYCCRFCGFRATSYQEIHHLNDDHTDHAHSNLATACAYCHMCHHIGLAGSRGEAILIWLPEIEQAELNHLVRAIQVAKHFKTGASFQPGMDRGGLNDPAAEFASISDALFEQLKARRSGAAERLGTDAPETLANVLMRMPAADYDRRGQFLAGIRLLPLGVRTVNSRDIMPEMIKAWTTGGSVFAGMKPPTWRSILRSYMEADRDG